MNQYAHIVLALKEISQATETIGLLLISDKHRRKAISLLENLSSTAAWAYIEAERQSGIWYDRKTQTFLKLQSIDERLQQLQDDINKLSPSGADFNDERKAVADELGFIRSDLDPIRESYARYSPGQLLTRQQIEEAVS